MATTAWGKCTVVGTWNDHAGALKAGTYSVRIPTRITDSADDVIVPKGVQLTGTLSTSVGAPSLSLQVLSNTDPDIFPHDGSWKVEITVTFTDGSDSEKYVIDTPVGGTVNLRSVILVETFPAQVASLVRGVAGGVAALNDTGQVVDASGNPVTGGGGGTTTVDGLTDATTVGKALVKAVDAAAARGAIAAAPTASPTFTGTVSGVTKAHVGLGNVDNTADTAKPVSTAQQTALDAKADAAAMTTALAAKAPLASPTFTGTVSGVTKAHVGLGNVDNTSDASKPVSTAQAAALAAKVPTTWGIRPRIAADSATTVPTRATWISTNANGYTGPVDWDLTLYLDHPGNTPGAQAAAQYQPGDGVYGRTS